MATPTNSDRRMLQPPRFRGDFVFPNGADYLSATAITNDRLRGHPAAVARCAGVADVRAALRVAREHGLEISVRSGGHSVAGWSSNDGGLVIDLTRMRNALVDPTTSTAWVGGGATASDILLEALEFGLVPVTGDTPNVGIVSLSMGVGEGFLSTKHGFAADNALAFQVVTAAGDILEVSADNHPELFWAMRGAGANFGVVTAMQVQLHPAPEQVVGGAVLFGDDDLAPVTQYLWQAMRDGSEDFFPMAVYELGSGERPQLLVVPGHVGPADIAEHETNQLRNSGKPLRDNSAVLDYVDLMIPVGRATTWPRQVWDLYRFDFDSDPDRQMATLLDVVRTWIPAGNDSRRVIQLWRTVPRPAPDPPSVVPRLAGITMFICSLWSNAAHDESEIAWLDAQVETFRRSGVVSEAANAMNHVSFPTPARVQRLYGEDSYERLRHIKTIYDPTNTFRRNYNIPPAAPDS